jgi:NAD(P)-dependent dehydrogenase (short-subunit alcohol dehydrogenase family)
LKDIQWDVSDFPGIDLHKKGGNMIESGRGLVQKRVVLVTGAGSGIGRACALAFAKDGATVVVVDQDEMHGIQTARMVETVGGSAHFIRCDISEANEVQHMIESVLGRFGRLDVAVNNAGIEGVKSSTVDCTLRDWDRVMAVNLRGTWLCMKYEISAMLKQGVGAIVNCSSIAGMVGYADSPAYSASKHGVVGLTQSAALECARSHIRINAVCPGVIQTPMIDRYVQGDERVRKGLADREPMGRLGNPSEVADAVHWLASDRASFVTGVALPVDGGWLAQ